jgi:ABC-2 type transport system permease protein
MGGALPVAGPTRLHVPGTFEQVSKLARYQLREYVRSRRFVALATLIVAIGGLMTALVAHFRGSLATDDLAFYGSLWGGGSTGVVVFAAVFFGGDAIAGEFSNKTGYFLMGLPIRRVTVYLGKFVAAYVASLAMLGLFLAILLGNGAYYFGLGFLPWQLGPSLLLVVVYLAAVLGATFLFSSLFKTAAYGFVLTAVLFFFGFTIIEGLVTGLVKMEPWMVISYASSVVGSVFSPPVNWGLHGTISTSPFLGTSYTAGIAEGLVIMIVYFVLTAVGGLLLFEREEFS